MKLEVAVVSVLVVVFALEFQILDYVPSVILLENVSQLSKESVDQVEVDPRYRSKYDATRLLVRISGVLSTAKDAAHTIRGALAWEDGDRYQKIDAALSSLRSALTNTNFNFPSQMYDESLLVIINGNRDVLHANNFAFGRSLSVVDLQELDEYLTVAATQVVAIAQLTKQIANNQQLQYLLKVRKFPKTFSTDILNEILSEAITFRAYDGYLNDTVERTMEASVVSSLVDLEKIANAPAQTKFGEHIEGPVDKFTSHVAEYLGDVLVNMRQSRETIDVHISETIEAVAYMAYGTQASAIRSLAKPRRKELPCIRTFMPNLQFVTESRLAEIGLCTLPSGVSALGRTMDNVNGVRGLIEQALHDVQQVVGCYRRECNGQIKDATTTLARTTTAVKGYEPEVSDFEQRVIACVDNKRELAIERILAVTEEFNQCLVGRSLPSRRN